MVELNKKQKEEILKLFDEEINYARKTGLAQFTLGLSQGRKIIEELRVAKCE